MSKKLTGNGLWESSRMIIPEHREEINNNDLKVTKMKKPILHDDEIEIIIQNIYLSKNENQQATIQVFGEFETRTVRGVVSSIDEYKKRIRIEIDYGYEWIDLDEVVSVRV